MIAILKRFKENEVQTLGNWYSFDDKKEVFTCKTLELPWKNNANDISCIPTGVYDVEKRSSESYGNHFYITNVPGRTMVLVHNGNYFKNTKGCVLVGKDHIDIDKDGYKDVTASKDTLKALYDIMPDKFKLYIIK